MSQRRYQAGVMTTFTGVLILVLLTLMMFFAMRVGVFEQRVSSNEMRQKLAFHAAESGVHHAKEFFRANSALVASYQPDLVPDTSVDKVGGEWPVWFDGWLADADATQKRWKKCSDWAGEVGVNLDLEDTSSVSPELLEHPCFGESAVTQRSESYFYSHEGSTELPVNTATVLGGNEEVRVQALLCVLNIDLEAPTPVQGCDTDPDVADGTYFMITLLARGQADCNDAGCDGEALVKDQVSNFGAAAGGRTPKVPLTTKSSFVPSGTAEVVPNPNAGGIGVPASVWLNANTSCGGSALVAEKGNWNTCEMHEWYGTDSMPESNTCPGSTPCGCSLNESISWSQGSPPTYGIDLIEDPNFPCDLFQFYFGVSKENYEVVKGYAKVIDAVTGCPELNSDSFGIYWVTGTECIINSNVEVGSKDAPIMLISAASITRMNGGAKIFGTVFITDAEDAGAKFRPNGTNTVYGSVIVDGLLDDYNGTFQVVWNDYITRKAGSSGGLGAVIGGWADFHRDWTFQ
jgi:hypothetical protein